MPGDCDEQVHEAVEGEEAAGVEASDLSDVVAAGEILI